LSALFAATEGALPAALAGTTLRRSSFTSCIMCWNLRCVEAAAHLDNTPRAECFVAGANA
jgi:hypothetical protein